MGDVFGNIESSTPLQISLFSPSSDRHCSTALLKAIWDSVVKTLVSSGTRLGNITESATTVPGNGEKGVGGGGGNGGGDGKRKRGEKEGNKIWNTLGQRGTEVETEQGTSVRKNIFGGFNQKEHGEPKLQNLAGLIDSLGGGFPKDGEN